MNAVFIQDILLAETTPILKVVSILVFNMIFLPMILRNYVELRDDTLYVAFGFSKNSIKISNIKEVTLMLNPTAAVASQDRIMVKGEDNELYFTVKNKELLLDELRSIKPDLVIRKG